MLKLFQIQVNPKTTIGDTIISEFVLPQAVGKISGFCANIIKTDNYENTDFRGFATISINEQPIVSIPSLKLSEYKLRSLSENLVKLEKPMQVASGSVLRISFNENIQEMQFDEDGNIQPVFYTLLVYVKYNR
jgi:hypothetical protein